MTPARIPRQASGFHLEEMDGELLLYHPGSTRTVLLNETASLVWRLCDGHRSSSAIASLLREAFPEQADAIDEDLKHTLTRLADEGAIEFA
jgi:Coenzyme PQQ synthesis protein D (PqqD)